ncbi:MAG: hypothetical protein MUF23_16625, partial [Pirellula sp.]|nr:hypothetical protein [Pirellula sp.]
MAQSNAGVAMTEMSGTVRILDVQAPTGDILLSVHDSVLSGEDFQLLENGGVTFFGASIPKGRIQAPNGNVLVQAGDHFLLPVGTRIESRASTGGSLVIRAGQLVTDTKDPDPTGAIITLAGNLVSASVQVFGGSNLDFFDLVNPNGIAAPTELYGLNGDDRFFIGTTASAMTVHGGEGANRYYISSNAARSLFLSNGVYSDLGEDLNFAFEAGRLDSGTLEAIRGPLTIHTGTGGNGGTRDSIFLSGAGSNTPLNGVISATTLTGLGNTAPIAYTTTADGGATVFVKLSSFNDQLHVTGAGARSQVFLLGGDGDDFVRVGTDGAPLSGLQGIVAFFGEDGVDDLQVRGVATPPTQGQPNPNQLSAISITGLGAGSNSLISTHNGLFGAGYTIPNVAMLDPDLDSSDWSSSRIQALSALLQTPGRTIDEYLLSQLSENTRKRLLDPVVGDRVVISLPGGGSLPIPTLELHRAYWVEAVSQDTIVLNRVQGNASSQIAVSRSLIGSASNQIGLLPLDAGFASLQNASPRLENQRLVYSSAHGLVTGQPVVYSAGNGNLTYQGLEENRVYFAIRYDDTTIGLADTVANAMASIPVVISAPMEQSLLVNNQALFNPRLGVLANEITFANRHPFTTGEAVVYRSGNVLNNNGSPSFDTVGGLQHARVYYVIRVNDTTVRLASSRSDAMSGSGLTGLFPASNAVTNNDTLTTARSFAASQIADNRLVFDQPPAFEEGQAVVYNKGQGNPDVGLVSGRAYLVQLVPGNPNAIRLRDASTGNLVSITNPGSDTRWVDTLTPTSIFAPAAVDNSNDVITTSQPHHLLQGQRVQYLPGSSGPAIEGLTRGQFYFVQLVDANRVKLLRSLGETAINIEAKLTASLDAVLERTAADLLTEDFNNIFAGASIYLRPRFEGVALRPETLQLLSQHPEGNAILNRLLLEDAYPGVIPALPSLVPALPGAVYYAQRFISRTGEETIQSSVENVEIQLSGSGNELQVDSTFAGSTNIVAGNGSTVTFGSSPTGLHPSQLRRIGFIDGSVHVSASEIFLDDSGNDQSTLGTLDGNQINGLGMSGEITLIGTPDVTVRLGASDDRFYVAGTAPGQEVTVEAGRGVDAVYVGTRPGAERTGSLAQMQGLLTVDGGSILTGVNRLFLQDSATTTPTQFEIDNDYDWSSLQNNANTIDTTTITRNGQAIVRYQRTNIVSLQGGSGGNRFDVLRTHREQSTDGSVSSSFTVNLGEGSDEVRMGAPVGVTGARSMDSFRQDLVAPTFQGSNPSRRGIPVLLNGQGGNDLIDVNDTSNSQASNVGLAVNRFRDLFPFEPDASVDAADIFLDVFGDDPEARAFATLAMAQDASRPINIHARGSGNQAQRVAAENLTIQVGLGNAGTNGNAVSISSGRYEVDARIALGSGNDSFNVSNGVQFRDGHTLEVLGQNGNDTVFLDFNGASVIDRGALGNPLANAIYSREDADS